MGKAEGRNNVLGALALGLGLTLGLAACSGSEGGSTPSAPTQAAKTPPPADMSDLLARSAERMELICAGDWIQAYDYYGQGTKEVMGLYEFLDGKQHHRYREPSEPEVVGTEDNQVFLQVSVLWKPMHPQVLAAQGGDEIEDRLRMVEIWEWNGRQWDYLENERASEFFALHPDLLKKN